MEKLTLKTGKRMTLFEFGIGLLNGPIKLLTIESPDEALSLAVIQAIEQKKLDKITFNIGFSFTKNAFILVTTTRLSHLTCLKKL